ncbi:MAG: HDOD domain-containing protein [Nitrospinaceae bacterium]|nr:HDOD domain-containing protein [Nitrospinaceae bacterium]NIR54903.1 HDOD domain-containing protein [Nitrospinaceae bacterium]NIS85331.1 HDOD domain-containing protein [Nitrospinaceae bacterium]NIT82141.1 HDOD domain-containing protein [Nitrospinaceae bacterium]NIU44400.1 HDOD domain-containing protein [Nitrospinaceae bacterium]
MANGGPRDLISTDEKVFSLPKVYFELQAALNDPDKTFQDIGEIISYDTALTARLLKIVNSSFYGFPSRIETVSHAISIIGMNQLTDLALATLVIYQFKGVPNTLFNMEKFWRHSMACGVAARSIAEIRGEKNIERFYLAGILHDIGRLVILKKEPEVARETLMQSRDKKENIYLSERDQLGFDHADVGGELLEAWQLPPRLVEAVRYHHQPQNAREFYLDTVIIHTADYIVHVLHVGSDADYSEPQLYPKSWEVIGISPDDFEFMRDKVNQQYEGIVKMFFQ